MRERGPRSENEMDGQARVQIQTTKYLPHLLTYLIDKNDRGGEKEACGVLVWHATQDTFILRVSRVGNKVSSSRTASREYGIPG